MDVCSDQLNSSPGLRRIAEPPPMTTATKAARGSTKGGASTEPALLAASARSHPTSCTADGADTTRGHLTNDLTPGGHGRAAAPRGTEGDGIASRGLAEVLREVAKAIVEEGLAGTRVGDGYCPKPCAAPGPGG